LQCLPHGRPGDRTCLRTDGSETNGVRRLWP